MKATPEQNKKLILEAFDTLFNRRDYAAAEKFWSPNYIQHSAHIEPGREGLFNLIKNLPATLKWTHGVILAEDDFVIVHSRYSGHGLPAPWIVADIVRIENGVLAEHWDVIQDEATKEQSKSGLPMFGPSFTKSDRQLATAPLTITEAREIVWPLYDALNQPGKKDVAALLAKAAHSDYRSYHTNEDFLTRDQLADVFKNLGLTVPDLRWEIKDIKTIGDQVVVRSSAKASKPPHGRQSPHGSSSQRRITPSIRIWSDSWPRESALKQKRLRRVTSVLFLSPLKSPK